MHKTLSPLARPGLTLVEVALAVAVGLLIIGSAIVGYSGTKDTAGNARARDKLMHAASLVEEIASTQNGVYPASSASNTAATPGSFASNWKQRRPDDFSTSPWGGPCGNPGGTDELAPYAGAANPPASGNTVTITPNSGSQSDLIYVSAQSPTQPYGAQNTLQTGAPVNFKNYAMGIYDKAGSPFFSLVGGK